MQCKTSLGLLLAGSLAWSCTGKKVELSRGDGFAFFKNPESNQACVNSNLSQWELTGPFLHKMLTCASNRSSDGGETLPATRNLLQSLDAEKLQKLVDFALIPDETANTHEGRYPYLLALAGVLDRGLTDGRKQGLELSAERLDQLQPFLLSLDPARIQSQMLIWSKSGKLEQLLSQLGYFLQSLEDDSISAISREVLAGSNFGPRFIQVSDAILSQNPLMNSLDSALSGTPLHELTKESRVAQLNDWRQPRSPDAPASAAAAPRPASQGTVTFAQHLNQFSSQLTDAEIANLSRFLTSFWNSYRGLPEQDRLFLSIRLVKGLEQSLDQQKNPAQWLLAVAQDLSSMPASDLNSISETLGRLLEPSNDPSLDTLRSKLWSSRMMEQMLDLIGKGGPVPGCSGLSIQGLKDLSSEDFAATYEVLRLLNQPHAACDQRAPLTAALETWSKVAIGRSCSDAECLELVPRENNAQVTASYWSQNFSEPAAETLQKLVRTTLESARQELIRDQFYLRNLGIAHRAVTPELMDQMLELWNENPARNLKELAAFDLKLMEDDRFQPVFSADALEKLLGLQVEQLSGLTQQFNQLLPATGRELDKATNQRAARVFAGAYSNGPLEQALRHKLPATATGADDILQDASWNWPEDVRKTFAEQRSLFSHFLFRFKKADSIFRNPELGSLSDGAEIPVAGLGSPSRYLSFDEAGDVAIFPKSDSQLIQPLQTIRTWSDDDKSSWGLWNQQLVSSPLVSKDLPPEQTANFETFSANFMEQISQESRWKELFATDEPVWNHSVTGVTPDFYEVEPYSPSEARLIALYYLRHYHKLPQAFPAKKSVSPLGTGSFRGFFSASSLVSRMDADYSLFVKLFPEQLESSAASLESLSQGALTVGSDGILFPPTKILPVTRVGLLAGKYPTLLAHPNFRLLSSLNLLGLTKSGTSFYIQPLIGLGGKSCVGADGKVASCAIELQSSEPNALATDYQTFVADVLAQNFCPLIASDRFGAKETWSQRLQLTTSLPSTCTSARIIEAPVGSDVRFPAWLTKRILNDVFSMGRHAQLKQGLAQIPAAMRFYKLSQQKLTAEQRATLFLRQARGDWNALNAASQSRRQFYAAQFWSGQPSLLNAYIDQWEQGIEPISWTDFLARLARRDGDGTSQDIVHELLSLVISTQQLNAKEGRSLLEMGLDLMEQISSRPDLLDAAGHVLGNFASSENYDFAGRDLPFAMTLFTSFNWNDAGLRFSKFISQQETIKVWTILCESFSPDEFGRLIRQIQSSSLELGTRSERSALLARFLRENVELGTLWDRSLEQTLSQRWDGVLSAWRHADFGADFMLQWESMLSTLDLPLKTLDSRSTYKTSEIMELWLPKILRQGMGLMSLHQEIGAVPETAFWSKVGLNFVHAVKFEPLGSRALSSFLAEPKLGFIQGGIWIKALTLSSARQSMAEALSSLSAVNESLWREALVESSQLLGRLAKAFGYMKQRMVWKEDPEHNAFRQVIDQLYALSSDVTLRDDQIALLQAWFRDDDAPGTAISLE